MALRFPRWLAGSIALIAATSMLTAEVSVANAQATAASTGAAAIAAGAAAGQALAGQITPHSSPAAVNSSGQIVLQPNSSSPMVINQSSLYPSAGVGGSSSTSSLSGLYGNNSAMGTAGTAAQARLKTENSPVGNAYQTVVGSSALSHSIPATDPVFRTTDQTLGNMTALAQTLSSCSQVTTYSSGSFTAHVPNYQTCQMAINQSSSTTLYHNYDYPTPIVSITSGDGTVTSCGSGCLTVALFPHAGDSSPTGEYVSNLAASVGWRIDKPGAIKSVTVSNASLPSLTMMTIGGLWISSWNGGLSTSESSLFTDCSTTTPSLDASSCHLNPPWINNGNGWYNSPDVGGEYDGCNITNGFGCTNGGSITPQALPANYDITNYFLGSTGAYRVIVAGPDSINSVTLTITYNPSAVGPTTDTWAPPAALQTVANPDSFCTVAATCTLMPTIDSNGCAIVNGNLTCPNQMVASPIAGISPLCQQVTANSNCSAGFSGQMDCYTDAQGNQQCPTNNASQTDTCAQYENNPNCGFISSSCIQGAEGASGTCYAQTETWDCGSNVSVPTTNSNTTYQCVGQIACMGTSCTSADLGINSPDFANAAAALQAAQFMQEDGSCNASGCTVFIGNAATCKKAMFGIVDCCTSATTPNMGQYISLLENMASLESSTASLGKYAPNAVSDAFVSLNSSVSSTASASWSAVQQPFVGAFNDITGTTSAATYGNLAGSGYTGSTELGSSGLGASEGTIGALENNFTQQTAQWVSDNFGPDMCNALFEPGANALGAVASNGTQAAATSATDALAGAGTDAGASAAADGGSVALASSLGAVMSGIGIAFAVYEIAMTLVKVIYACETSELQLDSNRQLKQCHYVGTYCAQQIPVVGTCIESKDSYCCFNSPLARIIQEQARPQLGRSWGDPKSPDCGGLTGTQLSEIDWSKINLSEWLGILASTGNIPTASTAATMSINSLTGSGGTIAGNSARPDALTAATQRLSTINVPQVNQGAAAQLFGTTK